MAKKKVIEVLAGCARQPWKLNHFAADSRCKLRQLNHINHDRSISRLNCKTPSFSGGTSDHEQVCDYPTSMIHPNVDVTLVIVEFDCPPLSQNPRPHSQGQPGSGDDKQ